MIILLDNGIILLIVVVLILIVRVFHDDAFIILSEVSAAFVDR